MKYLRILLLLLAAAILSGILALRPLLKGATGYSAKMLCSSIFIEGDNQQDVEQRELSAFPFNRVVSTVDIDNQQVKSSLLGLVSQTAVYKVGVGATLIVDNDNNLPERQPYAILNNDSLPWPMGNIIADTVPSGVDVEGLSRYIENTFKETSRAVVIVKDGQIVAEKYAGGITVNTPLLGWSMTKSLTALVTGILVKEGRLDIHKPVAIEAWQNDERKNITLNNLLQMSSGLQWNEEYSKTQLTDVSKMLYTEEDVYKFAIASKKYVKPDSVWYYSSGTSNILSGLIRSCFNNYHDYYQYPQKALFNKLGMCNSLVETDAVGNYVSSSYGYCSARDWTKLGMLYLNNGNWLGEQILPEWWVDYSTTPARKSGGQYGAHLWLNASQLTLPDLPSDTYFFSGYRGQRVVIIPSKKMVITYLNSVGSFDHNRYLSGLLQFVN